MKSILTGRARLLAGAVALAAPLSATALPAHAAAKVDFLYSAPEISAEGDSVTWDWTVRNSGGEAVDKVVLVHRLTPQLKVTSVSAPCKVLATSVRCDYGRLATAGRKKGTLVAAIPATTSGSVQITGRVTWQRADAADADD
ncbi:DUF11 domain-containing protein [Actinomadura hibisca]|uniref:DUF11 domain-containing protein n=1 Tax=Actinomadura hibisca TaxID=68565 RepID=UPI000834E8F6|nr:DUF11 domain-containing protein [Actinomadura hibisca]